MTTRGSSFLRPLGFPAFWRILGLLAGLLVGGAAAAAPTDANQVIVPGGAGAKPEAPAHSTPGSGAFTVVAVLVLAGAGAWLLWRGRGKTAAGFGRGPRNLAVEETRSLGGRQYLVVASYQDKKFLLGVCPGRIELLAPLSGAAESSDKREQT